jgi:hypothetical protein
MLLIVVSAFTPSVAGDERSHRLNREREGAEYACLVGRRFVAWSEGRELKCPPLFRWLIAAFAVVVHQIDIAGRMVAVRMETLRVLAMRLAQCRLLCSTPLTSEC